MSKADERQLKVAVYRIKIHKDNAELTNGTCIVNKQDLEIVLKELKRLQEENVIQRKQLNDAFDRGFIHKDKIREKMEELNKYIYTGKMHHKIFYNIE